MSEPHAPYRPGDLLAHGPGMVLLDAVHALDDDAAECTVTIGAHSRFFEAGHGVPNWVGIEYMAQTIGVHAGYLRVRAGRPVLVGLLLGTRSYDCEPAWFAEGAQLVIRAQQLVADGDGVAIYDCHLSENGVVIARAQIKAFQPDDVDAFLDRIYGASE